MRQIDQGTVIYGIRSDKYPGIRCFGIIITASCDIAQDKVGKLYYLLAADAKDWFCSRSAYSQVYLTKIQNLKKNFADVAFKCALNPEFLQDFTREELIHIIETEVQEANMRKKIISAYDNLAAFYAPEMSAESIKAAIKADGKPIETFLSQIDRGQILHYYYLPQTAYMPNERRDAGLIIDLQEIGYLTLGDACRIDSEGIDYLNLPLEGKEKERLIKQFWLESKDDFVEIEGSIKPPWREHLMQRFSHGFIRIGLNGATKADYTSLVSSI